jgi:hypothetical protein
MLNNIAALIGGAAPVVGDYESIATVNGTGSSGVITFTSIPSTYKHLQIRGVGGSTTTGSYSVLNINGDTGSNYKQHWLQGAGSGTPGAGVGSGPTSIDLYSTANATANSQAAFVIDILDYTSTNKNKTIRSFAGVDNNGSGFVDLDSGLYFATPAAITSLSFTINAGSWRTTSSFALYGIK